MKITKDGFVWLLISKEQAIAQWSIENGLELFLLYDDETEGEPNSIEDIEAHKGEFGIEVGYLATQDELDTLKDENKNFANFLKQRGLANDQVDAIAKGFLSQ